MPLGGTLRAGIVKPHAFKVDSSSALHRATNCLSFLLVGRQLSAPCYKWKGKGELGDCAVRALDCLSMGQISNTSQTESSTGGFSVGPGR